MLQILRYLKQKKNAGEEEEEEGGRVGAFVSVNYIRFSFTFLVFFFAGGSGETEMRYLGSGVRGVCVCVFLHV